VQSVACSPDGRHIISGSYDHAIQIWDVETGATVGDPLEGHTDCVQSVTYSPDGRNIISGSSDGTVRIWDAGTGAAVGNPLEGHASIVTSVAYSPDGRHIISGSLDRTIRVWDAKSGPVAGKSLDGHTCMIQSTACSPDRQHIVSGSHDTTTRACDPFTSSSIPSSSCDPMRAGFWAKPDLEGWVKDSEGGLLLWIPHDCRKSLHSPALLTIPLTSRNRSVSLDFDNCAFGTSWTQIFKSAPS